MHAWCNITLRMYFKIHFAHINKLQRKMEKNGDFQMYVHTFPGRFRNPFGYKT